MPESSEILLSVVMLDPILNLAEKNEELCLVSKAEFIPESALGSAAAGRNRAARRAKGKWILFLDGDCGLQAGALESILGKIESRVLKESHLYSGVYKLREGASFWSRAYDELQLMWLLKDWNMGSESAAQVLGGCLLMDRNCFFEIGAFDEAIPWAGEETELLLRAKGRGLEPRLLTDLQIHHHHNLGVLGFLKRGICQGFRAGERALQGPRKGAAFYFSRISELSSQGRASEVFAMGIFWIANRLALHAGKLKQARKAR